MRVRMLSPTLNHMHRHQTTMWGLLNSSNTQPHPTASDGCHLEKLLLMPKMSNLAVYLGEVPEISYASQMYMSTNSRRHVYLYVCGHVRLLLQVCSCEFLLLFFLTVLLSCRVCVHHVCVRTRETK